MVYLLYNSMVDLPWRTVSHNLMVKHEQMHQRSNLLIAGDWSHGILYDFPIMGMYDIPNWRSHIFQRGGSTTNHIKEVIIHWLWIIYIIIDIQSDGWSHQPDQYLFLVDLGVLERYDAARTPRDAKPVMFGARLLSQRTRMSCFCCWAMKIPRYSGICFGGKHVTFPTWGYGNSRWFFLSTNALWTWRKKWG